MSEVIFTPGEMATWRAVYAAAWFQATSGGPGAVSDEVRALWAAGQADRAVLALRGCCNPSAQAVR